MKKIPSILKRYEINYSIVPISQCSTNRLVEFFANQPEEAYRFFKPHDFDAVSIQRLQKNKSFLAYIFIDKCSNDNKIVGYCFNRSFFHGRGFRGRMVDINYRGRGLGTKMNKILNDVGFCLGLRLFETVSVNNTASYRSAISASDVRIIKKMPNGDLYLEVINKGDKVKFAGEEV